ncbi:hypothetical protein E4U43_007573 [Claviceps pusilla]|uniref:Endo-chitosanase n=1 Tax=Claviceps pusilla TaxID=123648 RepID=A0A9P7NHH6_9HYPO|nr:hypothetical protein E4U43_007573 [Claviceps pusilla]
MILSAPFFMAWASLATARDVPSNVKALYDQIRSQGQCQNVLAGGFHSQQNDRGNFDYCADHLRDDEVIYIQGRRGALANMDVDCDGIQHALPTTAAAALPPTPIWGDENGDDGPQAMVGEASIALATACFGHGVNGNAGHDKNDVLYLAFPGKDAVPGAKGAKWNAQKFDAFEASIASLGDKLIKRIGKRTGAGS